MNGLSLTGPALIKHGCANKQTLTEETTTKQPRVQFNIEQHSISEYMLKFITCISFV